MSRKEPPCIRVTVDAVPSILQPPPALRPIVSASLCPLGWEEKRGEGKGEGEGEGGSRGEQRQK